MIKRRQFMGAVGGALATASTQSILAQGAAWPQRPVTIVVPYAPGGSSDILGRLIATRLSTAFGQSFVIENQSGASGAIGSQRVARAAPDGYTLLVADVGSHIVAPLMFGQGPFDPMNDFTHIAMLGGAPFVLAVNSSQPIRNLQDFVAYTRAQPKGGSWGSPGPGSRGHLMGEMFKADNQLNMIHIAYKGAGQAVTDLLGAQIPAAFVTLTSITGSMKAGKLRGIGITSEQRMPDFPDVPTFAEQGYPRLTSLASFMLSGPANLPPAMVDRINAEVRQAIGSPEMQKIYATEGVVATSMSSAELHRFLIKERDQFAQIIKSQNITVSR